MERNYLMPCVNFGAANSTRPGFYLVQLWKELHVLNVCCMSVARSFGEIHAHSFGKIPVLIWCMDENRVCCLLWKVGVLSAVHF
jgi:hypothetical protein